MHEENLLILSWKRYYIMDKKSIYIFRIVQKRKLLAITEICEYEIDEMI